MSIYLLTALTRASCVQSLVPLVLDGRIREVSAVAQDLAETQRALPANPSCAEAASLCADLMLAQDRDEEAEELYRMAVRAAANAPRGQVRVTSCRSTGLLSLYRHRLGTAADCFQRLANDTAATLAQKVEALGCLAMACHGMGHTAKAMQALDNAAELASGAPAAAGASTLMFIDMLRVELLVRQELRAHAALHDHVFWHAPAAAAMPRAARVDALQAIAAALEAHGHHRLLAQCLQHWRAQLLACGGDVAAMRSLHDHLAWLRQAGLPSVEREERLETVLVAIVIRDADMARSMFDPFCSRNGEPLRERWNVEVAYCLAKVCAMTGRAEESFRHYQRYALETVQCLRAETPAEPNGPHASGRDSRPGKDGVEMSLPAKYRRAYRYMIDRLDSPALSVREISEHIGVTERALQSAFRAHLGMTPAEVLRRCRVERIRGDLLTGDSGGLTVIEAASRWGIRNRSTLVSSYRKYFDETPAQTLSRRSDVAIPA